MDMINVEAFLDGSDLGARLEAVRALTCAVELLDVARRHPDHVECEGDADLFENFTWAAAQMAHEALELYHEQHPRPAVREVGVKRNGEDGA